MCGGLGLAAVLWVLPGVFRRPGSIKALRGLCTGFGLNKSSNEYRP